MPSTPNLKAARSDAQGFSLEFAEDSSGLPLLLSATEAARQTVWLRGQSAIWCARGSWEPSTTGDASSSPAKKFLGSSPA
jgi:hypothetical protein